MQKRCTLRGREEERKISQQQHFLPGLFAEGDLIGLMGNPPLPSLGPRGNLSTLFSGRKRGPPSLSPTLCEIHIPHPTTGPSIHFYYPTSDNLALPFLPLSLHPTSFLFPSVSFAGSLIPGGLPPPANDKSGSGILFLQKPPERKEDGERLWSTFSPSFRRRWPAGGKRRVRVCVLRNQPRLNSSPSHHHEWKEEEERKKKVETRLLFLAVS